jgi:hypothetical protein
MSTFNARAGGPIGGAHPAVLNSRKHELMQLVLSAVIPLTLALAISTQVAHPRLLLLFAGTAGAISVVALMLSPRYELTLVIVALYLGLLEGPAKLGTGAHEAASVVRDVLIFSISVGAVLRIVVRRERIQMPPLSAWVVAFVALVLAEALNPNTHGLLKALGGFRQQLEWVPFFFFGYALLRTKERFRKLLLVLGVIALANGVVSTYQTRLSPGQLASWGPGYKELVFGSVEAGKGTGLTGRTYSSEGVARIRPPGLGTDAGFAGGVGVIALPGLLALLAAGRVRRRWLVVVLCLGALVGVATGLGRLQVVGAVIAIIVFAGLSFSAGKRVKKALAALLGVLILAVPVGVVLVSVEAKGTFSRYSTISPENVASSKDKKTSSLKHIPALLEAAPFGVGLATAGAAAGFGGKQTELLEGHGVSAETQYNFIADELGLPGLLLWVALSFRLITLGLRRLRRVPDVELRLYLAALLSVLIAMAIMGFSGPTMSSAAFGPFFWFTAGVFGYWFLGPGRRAQPAAAAAAS